MIGFLQPLALLGLAAAAIPPLLHLLGRRRPPTVVFPAVRYLTATEREHSRRLKLRHLLLMLLRTVVLVLLVLAAARPVAPVGGDAHPPTAVVLVVDNSLSAGAVVGGRRVLDVLVERAQGVLGRMAADDRLWLVLADGVPRRSGRAEAARVLDSLTPWPVRLDLTAAVSAGARAAAGAGLARREVVVVSDLQATALTVGAEPDAPVLVWVPPEMPANRAIDSAFAEPPVWSPSGAVVADVAGEGAETDEAAVRLSVAGRDVARAVARPGQRAVLSGAAERPGWWPAAVALDPDELRADDRWWLALAVSEPAAVRVDPGGGRFVVAALDVLTQGGRAVAGDAVVVGDRLVPGTAVLVPPDDPALLGALNRALARRGVAWRFGERVAGEWTVEGPVGAARGVPVYRRHRLLGPGVAVATVGGEPWLVRAGDVVLLGSRLEPEWTALPVHAGFIPFLDLLVNRVAARQVWIVRTRPGAVVELPAAADALLLPAGPAPVPSERRLPAPLEPGVYFLRGAAGDTVGALEVNHDWRESRLAPADRRIVRATLGADARLLGDAALVRELFGGAGRAELSGGLLLAALAAAVAELFVAAGAAARRSAGD